MSIYINGLQFYTHQVLRALLLAEIVELQAEYSRNYQKNRLQKRHGKEVEVTQKFKRAAYCARDYQLQSHVVEYMVVASKCVQFVLPDKLRVYRVDVDSEICRENYRQNTQQNAV